MRESDVIIFDLHSDIPTDIVVRRAFGERAVFQRRHANRLLANGVRAVVLAIWVEPTFRDQAAQRALQIVGALMADLSESSSTAEIIKNAHDLNRCITAKKIAVMLSIEGMTLIEQWPIADTVSNTKLHSNAIALDLVNRHLQDKSSQSLAIFKSFGVREAMLVWGESNEIASGPGKSSNTIQSTGLTDFGKYVVSEWEQADILIDISHLDDRSTSDVIEVANGIVIASHSNARALCDHPRNLSDMHLKAIAARNGVVGLNTYALFVDANHATLDRFIDHIVYISDLIGIEHVSMGFDFMDYLPDHFGFPERTKALECIEDVPRLIERMIERKLSHQEITKIMFDNSARVMCNWSRTRSNEDEIYCSK